MQTTESRDVIVVGAGPAGCAAAILLHRRGLDVVLFDEAQFPRDKICGESISPEAWRLLRLLGLEDRVAALGPYSLRGMTLVAPDGTIVRGDYLDRSGLAIRRLDFDHALLQGARAAGIEVREGVRVAGLVRIDGCVNGVVFKSGDSHDRMTARLVVGADGRRSVVARKLGLLSAHPRFRKFAVRGHWEGVEGLEERGEMHVGGGGYCGIAPLSATSANVTFVLDQQDFHAGVGELESFYRNTVERRWPRVGERLERGTLASAPRAIGPLALVASRVSAPGALLVGDAAGFYDPFTGEGVTLALHSAEIAAEFGARALATGSVASLEAYDAERHAATAPKFRFNRLVQSLVGHPRIANRMAHRLKDRPDLADRLVRIAGDFVPARAALDPGFLFRLLFG